MAKDKRIISKLKDRHGASILMAMIVFLTATMVSVVLISAALTAAKRVKDDRRDKEEYLAVSSAARVFTGQLKSLTCVKTVNVQDDEASAMRTYYDSDNSDGVMTVYNADDSSDDNRFDILLEQMVKDADSGTTPKYTFDISLSGTGEESVRSCEVKINMNTVTTLPEVLGEYTEVDAYKIYGKITPKYEGEDAYKMDDAYKVYFTMWLDLADIEGDVTTMHWGGMKTSNVIPPGYEE